MTPLRIFCSLLIICGAFGLDSEWWKHATIYEIYLRSFKDSDGDGIGDIKGLISKLDYLADLGVDTIYLPPFYPSAGADGGYDITDYKGIDPVYGTMEDFKQLIKEMKDRNLHLVTDLVINHSSDKHEWFEKSVDRIDPYTDYYMWADPKDTDYHKNPIKPNNWISLFDFTNLGSAWTWNEKRKQFYLHQCKTEQPDLNLRNEAVKNEIKNLMRFWLDKGVSGFRVDAPMAFMEDEQLRDNPPLDPDVTVFTIFKNCERSLNHPDTYRFINELNVFLRQYDRRTKRKIQTPLIGETLGPVENVMKYFGTNRFPAFHLPFNFRLTSLKVYLNARELNDYLHAWMDKLPKGRPSNWALGNHDTGRIVHYFNPEYNPILLALVTMLPGTSSVYYGEELGMSGNTLFPSNDEYKRDWHRTPMHWDDTRNAGFTSAENSWLPVHPNYWHVNVLAQSAQKNSTLNYFKDLMSLRKTDTVKYGDLKAHILSKWLLAYSRTFKGTTYIILMNLGTKTELVNLHTNIENIPKTLTVLVSSPNSGYNKGFRMETSPDYPTSSILRPHSVNGRFERINVKEWLLAYSRTFKGTTCIVLMNLGTKTELVNLHTSIENIPKTLTVLASSPNSGYNKGFRMETSPNYPTSSILRPHSVVILSS